MFYKETFVSICLGFVIFVLNICILYLLDMKVFAEHAQAIFAVCGFPTCGNISKFSDFPLLTFVVFFVDFIIVAISSIFCVLFF